MKDTAQINANSSIIPEDASTHHLVHENQLLLAVQNEDLEEVNTLIRRMESTDLFRFSYSSLKQVGALGNAHVNNVIQPQELHDLKELFIAFKCAAD
jgi:hypothetical protein